MAQKKKPAPRKGGKPTYTPETAERRAAGRIELRLPPQLADMLRQRGAEHPRGVSGVVIDWLTGASAG